LMRGSWQHFICISLPTSISLLLGVWNIIYVVVFQLWTHQCLHLYFYFLCQISRYILVYYK
jgi:hypothetical protein